jgi:anti-sigma factor RsiW
MNLVDDRFRLHAYVDGELTPVEIAELERELLQHPDAMAEVAALRAQNRAMHARYDGLLTAASTERIARFDRRLRWSLPFASPTWNFALAATIVAASGVGIAAGWMARGQSDQRALAVRDGGSSMRAASGRDTEGRLQSFVQTASLSHAIFVPEVRHPVEVTATDEAHLVTWLSKRLAAPLIVPHLGDAGWELLGGRLLPDESGPVAQFMYQDKGARRMTLAVSKSVAGKAAVRAGPEGSRPEAAFRIAEENGNTVFYWIDADYAYALTGRMSKSEMTSIASLVYRQLDAGTTQAAPR